ncbi:unnamed protein product [Ilex paraguariensis]|uniref:Uncharacterized protein n=1 Tax=Ilex paraguariensis TaxID=185542 RepID=A0ABC8QWC1_9AQUA
MIMVMFAAAFQKLRLLSESVFAKASTRKLSKSVFMSFCSCMLIYCQGQLHIFRVIKSIIHLVWIRSSFALISKIKGQLTEELVRKPQRTSQQQRREDGKRSHIAPSSSPVGNFSPEALH